MSSVPVILDRRRTMALLLCAAGTASSPASSAETFDPPLWVVRKGSSKVYLFGEMFAGRDFGKSPKVVAAFDESATYWKETPPLSKGFGGELSKLGQAETPLSQRLQAEDLRRLLAAAAAVKVQPETIMQLRGWLVVQRLQGPLYQAIGVTMQQDAGVSEAARSSNKQTRYEFADDRTLLRYFGDMTQQVEEQYVLSMLSTYEQGREAWSKRAEAWAVGDISAEDAHARKQARAFPTSWNYLTTTRNKRWAPRIQSMLETGATSFVRVGFDHLIGPESVQRQLSKLGLKVERI